MRPVLKYFLIGISISFFIFMCYFFFGKPPRPERIEWGVNFSQKHSQNFGLDWRQNFLALLDDLKFKNVKLITHWDLIEPEREEYRFEDLDWQMRIAEEKGVNLLLVVGMKTPRWPECHIPGWAKNLTKEEQQKEILKMVEKVILRYQDSPAIKYWQVENEPFFPFGECPWSDEEFVKKEINLVKSLDDQKRPVVISDSGEGSLWIKAARLGDIVGTTMYKKVWFRQLKTYIYYPFPPSFYWRKAEYIKKIFNKKVIVVEFQAEPWGPTLLYNSPLEEQEKTMNLERFRKNIEFAKKTGFDEFYFWGGEWWYWLKEKHNKPEIWEDVRILLAQ